MIDILMPALSPTMEEGAVVKWSVKPGDFVRAGDVIAEIETDKATMEVEAADEGFLVEILAPEGSEGIKVNTPIARLSEQAVAPVSPPAPTSVPERSEPTTPERPAPPSAEHRRASSPLARRMARQGGIDLATLAGSGPHGRIVKRDVERALGGAADAPPAPALATPPAPPRQTLEQMGITPGSYELVPLDGMRRTVANRLVDSIHQTPHFPLTIDVELDALLAARASLNAALAPQGVKISVNDMVLKASALALKRVPQVNASFTPDGVAFHAHADIAMAVALDGGLITPIVRAVETKGLAQIATETRDLAERARAKRLKPEEYMGGTFSISNLGMFGVKQFSSIINPPQGAILSVGAGEPRPVVRDGQLAVATILTVTLTCDHRVMDGAAGSAWLGVFKSLIETPLLGL